MTIAVTCLTLMAVRPAAQEPAIERAPVPFRASTDLVQVDVSVLDDRRRPVRGLTQADFTLLEDGEPRPIEVFTAIDLPERAIGADAPWTRQVPPDVVTNQVVEQEGRLVVILLDRSIPIGQPTIAARQIAAEAVNTLGPGDLAAVVSTSGGVPQNLTASRERLLRAIGQRDWSTGASDETQEIEQRLFEESGVPGPFPFTSMADGRCLCGVCVPQTITRVAESLRDVPRRRKLLLFIGSGITFQTTDDRNGCSVHLRDAREAMLRALDASSVTVHSIDPAGLEAGGPAGRASSTLRGSRVVDRVLQETSESQAGRESLRVLPERTGGRTILNTNAPQAYVPEVFHESASYYVLGFRPREGESTRRVRAIDVRVNRRDVRVHARKQYEVPTATGAGNSATTLSARAVTAAAPLSPVTEALTGLLPSTRLPMGVAIGAFAVPNSTRAALTLAADLRALVPPDTVLPDEAAPIEIAAAAYDPTGRPVASLRQTLTVSRPSTSGPSTAPDGLDVLSRLDLEPGEYEIRVAASGPAGTASVFTHTTVPPFASAPLSLSNIIVVGGRTAGTVPADMFAGLLPGPPVTRRAFARSEPVTAFMRIYQGTGRTEPIQPVQLRVRILDAQDRTVRDEALVFALREFASARTADCRLTLPTRTLPVGQYLLTLEVTMGERVAGRAMRFEIN
jgi:VWFA-related protein